MPLVFQQERRKHVRAAMVQFPPALRRSYCSCMKLRLSAVAKMPQYVSEGLRVNVHSQPMRGLELTFYVGFIHGNGNSIGGRSCGVVVGIGDVDLVEDILMETYKGQRLYNKKGGMLMKPTWISSPVRITFPLPGRISPVQVSAAGTSAPAVAALMGRMPLAATARIAIATDAYILNDSRVHV